MPTDALVIRLVTISPRTEGGFKDMTTIHTDEVRPGDVVMYNGHDRLITRVDWQVGWAWPVAADNTGWAIALGGGLVEVRRQAA
jgi:hypothetical protein